ncbi:head-tail adaptor protein [Cloacibacillus evryensis]|uniref:head-tail adaptor protein n=1 Tax=Cloacibacillus evryensis TaxID=508460 RepID=UPI0004AE4D39|nr:head-tail adaptor protein [Cloacibacillus evryensis]
MNPGSLSEQITITRAVFEDDGMGGSTTRDTTIFSGWAAVTAKKSKDGLLGGRDIEVRTHLVIMRLPKTEPQKGDVIAWRGKSLTVKAVRPDYRAAQVELDCIQEA